jgi:ADP-ribosylglycohydrolase
METSNSRILGCLAGLAVGDAMGRPTELLFNYRRIEKRYGRVESLVGDRPGAVTDDTRLTLALADAILAAGRMVTSDELIERWKRHPEFTWRKFLRSYNRSEGFWIGEHLAAWGGRMGIPGHLTGYMNPSSLFAGNEAAMIMAPVGIVFRGRPIDAAASAREVSRALIVGEALDAAAAWAAAIASALSDGATVASVLDAAREFAPLRLRSAMDRALSIADRYPDPFSARPELYRCCLRAVTVDARETIPIALAMFRIADGDPMLAVTGGANFGRDSDTIAGMAGLLAGSLNGIERIDPDIYRTVSATNGFDLDAYAAGLEAIAG